MKVDSLTSLLAATGVVALVAYLVVDKTNTKKATQAIGQVSQAWADLFSGAAGQLQQKKGS
jgi:hypothetical protein